MKLIFAIVQNDDVKKLNRALNKNGFSVTKISSSGGFLQGGNATLMLGVEDSRVEAALEIIRTESCQRKQYIAAPQEIMPGFAHTTSVNPVQVVVGGAVVFITDVWRYEHF